MRHRGQLRQHLRTCEVNISPSPPCEAPGATPAAPAHMRGGDESPSSPCEAPGETPAAPAHMRGGDGSPSPPCEAPEATPATPAQTNYRTALSTRGVAAAAYHGCLHWTTSAYCNGVHWTSRHTQLWPRTAAAYTQSCCTWVQLLCTLLLLTITIITSYTKTFYILLILDGIISIFKSAM